MLKEILKKQEEEYIKKGCPSWLKENYDIWEFIQKYNAKIIKAVTEEMTGKKKKTKGFITGSHILHCELGYNKRVQEEQEKAKELIEESI